MSLRSALYALAFVFATAVVFILVSLAAIFFLAGRNCGASFGYYGCASPSATTPADDDVDQVARAGEDRALISILMDRNRSTRMASANARPR